jgi:hypothetical protein
LYAGGIGLKALQGLLGHQWLSTASAYIHVRSDHVELSWMNVNRRLETRVGEGGGIDAVEPAVEGR